MEEEDTPEPLPIWSKRLLALPEEPTSDDRRRAMLMMLRDQSFVPGRLETLAFQRVVERTVPPVAVNWIKPGEAKFETVHIQVKQLKERFQNLAQEQKEAEVAELLEVTKPIPILHRYARQFENAIRIEAIAPTSQESESLKDLAKDWLLEAPTRFADRRFEWFEERMAEKQILLATLKNDEPVLYKSVPGLAHYLKVKDPDTEEDSPKRRRKISLETSVGDLAIDVPPPRRARTMIVVLAIISLAGLGLLKYLAKDTPKSDENVIPRTVEALKNYQNRNPKNSQNPFQKQP